MAEDRAQGSPEDKLIARFFKPIATHPGALGLTDDAACLSPPAGYDLVLTTDAVTSGVHFLADTPPDVIARRALRVNLSDIAAKGAKPLGCLLSVALPQDVDDKWLSAFTRGLAEDTRVFNCPLLGGDTDRSEGPISVTLFAVGAVPEGKMVKRTGAKPGDRLFVSGSVGDAALGLKLRRNPALAYRWNVSGAAKDHLLERYALPQPRLKLADALCTYASAAIDVSDGFAGDLLKLCRLSDVSVDIEIGRLPLSQGARSALMADSEATVSILTGGDDYEIICTVPESNARGFVEAAGQALVTVSELGVVGAGAGRTRFLDGHGRPLVFTHPAFSHF